MAYLSAQEKRLKTNAHLKLNTLGEEDQMPPDNMTGGLEFVPDLWCDEEELQDYSNGDFDAQEAAYHPDEHDQPTQSMDDFVPEFPEQPSTSYTQDLSSDTGPIDCSQDFFGITGGSEVSETPTQALGSVGPQSYQLDNLSAISRNYQGWGTNNTQPLSGFVQHDQQPTVNVSVYNDGQGTVHECNNAEGWPTNVTAKNTTDFEAFGVPDQTPTFVQPFPNQSVSQATPHNDSLHWLHQMDKIMADPPALADLENVPQAPRRSSDGPWSHVPAVGDSFGYDYSTASYRDYQSGGGPVSESSFAPSSASNLLNTMTPSTSVPLHWHGMVDSMPTLRLPSHTNRRPRTSRPRSRASMSAYPRSESNGEPTRPVFLHGGHITSDPVLSRSSSHRLSIPGESNSTFAPASPALSNVSMTATNTSFTPSDVPEVLECEIAWCNATFTGGYRKGNCQRHMRLKHGQTQRTYPCEADGCSKIYKRQDARLKHYRKRHPRLAPGPALSRKEFSSM